MSTKHPLFRGVRALVAGSALAILLTAPIAFADQADGRYDLPDHALAAGDPIGSKLFDRDRHVVLKPRHEEMLDPEAETGRNELPSWPAKWAPAEDDEY